MSSFMPAMRTSLQAATRGRGTGYEPRHERLVWVACRIACPLPLLHHVANLSNSTEAWCPAACKHTIEQSTASQNIKMIFSQRQQKLKSPLLHLSLQSRQPGRQLLLVLH